MRNRASAACARAPRVLPPMRVCRVVGPPLVEQLAKGGGPLVVAQCLGGVRAHRLGLAVMDGLAGVLGQMFGDRDSDTDAAI